jgi:hypothetical protein
MVADGADHPARLFAVLVGQSAKARKGTSWRNIQRIMEIADPVWADTCVVSGLSTGEGLISAVRDPLYEKRCMAIEEEFARTLINSGRGNNTLASIVREAYDGQTLRTMTKKPMVSTTPHVSVLGHVTVEELQARLGKVHRYSGFANRFAFFAVQRSKLLPSGAAVDRNILTGLGIKVLDALTDARDVGIMSRSDDAERRWETIYRRLDAEQPFGEVGQLAARAEATILRFAVAYALTDGKPVITEEHVAAADALWRYSQCTLEFVFGFGDPVADRLFQAISESDTGLSLTEQSALFDRHKSKARLQEARTFLEGRGLIVTVREPTGGGPRLVSFGTAKRAKRLT